MGCIFSYGDKIDKELFVIYIVIDFCRDCIINIYCIFIFNIFGFLKGEGYNLLIEGRFM